MADSITFQGKTLTLIGGSIAIGANAPEFEVVSWDLKEVKLSDYKTSSFSMKYGLLIKELNLIARSVQIIDKDDIVRYRQVVPELTMPPDYNEALKALKGLA